ncbi:MAG: LPS export ABC transporter periplasmic protein LptC [Gammaproteobacteria bacterium]|nr:LPS export ABC transporter periplasmic protein LptC [Gammaproteobacteria bacterium]
MNRSIILSVLAIAIVLAVGLLTLLYIKPLSILTNHKMPDTYIRNFNYSAYDRQGHLKCVIKSPKLMHYPKNDMAYLTTPDIIFYGKQSPWHITADHGKSMQQNNKIILWGHVIIQQMATKKQSSTRILTPKIIIYPQRSYAQSNKPITVLQPHTTIHGIGFTANFKTGRMTLLNHARGIYHAPAKISH